MQKKRNRNIVYLIEIWRRFRKNKLALAGLIVFSSMILIALCAELITPYENVTRMNVDAVLKPPCASHWFGTDSRGRDMFARVIHGLPSSLFIGITVSFFSMIAGTVLGLPCGYFGGSKFDIITMRLLDITSALPGYLLAIVLVAVLGPNMRNLIIALIIDNVAAFARLSRSAVLSISQLEYIEAAKSGGSSNLRILLKHALPNATSTLIINLTMSISGIIRMASSLSFLGLGVQPPSPELGALLNDSREYFQNAPYLMFFPGLVIIIVVISINVIGDGLRDALDPKLKN